MHHRKRITNHQDTKNTEEAQRLTLASRILKQESSIEDSLKGLNQPISSRFIPAIREQGYFRKGTLS